MKTYLTYLLIVAAFGSAAGCQKQQVTDSDAIRDGIQAHLNSLKTLNLSAMDMKISNLAITGNIAQADVEFVPKTGAPPGAGMRVSYSLQKRAEQWFVVKTNSLGGAIDHPPAGANPHLQSGPVHGNLPNFRDLIPPTKPNADPELPAGHPPVPPAENPKQY